MQPPFLLQIQREFLLSEILQIPLIPVQINIGQVLMQTGQPMEVTALNGETPEAVEL